MGCSVSIHLDAPAVDRHFEDQPKQQRPAATTASAPAVTAAVSDDGDSGQLEKAARAAAVFNLIDHNRNGAICHGETVATLERLEHDPALIADLFPDGAASPALAAAEFASVFNRGSAPRVVVKPTATIQAAVAAPGEEAVELCFTNEVTGEKHKFSVVVRARDLAEVPEAVSYQWKGDKVSWTCNGRGGTCNATTIDAVRWCVEAGKEVWVDALCIPLSGAPFAEHAPHMGELYLHTKVVPCELWGQGVEHLSRGWVQQEMLIPQLCDEALTPEVIRDGASQLIAQYEALSQRERLLSAAAWDAVATSLAADGDDALASEEALLDAALKAVGALRQLSEPSWLDVKTLKEVCEDGERVRLAQKPEVADKVVELTAGVDDETSKLVMTVLAIGALGRPREMFETVQVVKRLHGDAALAARATVANMLFWHAGNRTYLHHVTGVAACLLNRSSEAAFDGSRTSLVPLTWVLGQLEQGCENAGRVNTPSPELLSRLEKEFGQAPFTVEADRTLAVFGTWNALTGDNRRVPDMSGADTNKHSIRHVQAQQSSTGFKRAHKFVDCSGEPKWGKRAVQLLVRRATRPADQILICEVSFCCCFERATRDDGTVRATWVNMNKNSFEIRPGKKEGTYEGDPRRVARINGSGFHEMLPARDKPAIAKLERNRPDFPQKNDEICKVHQHFFNLIQEALRTPGRLTEKWSECLEGDLVIS